MLTLPATPLPDRAAEPAPEAGGPAGQAFLVAGRVVRQPNPPTPRGIAPTP